MSPGHKRFFLEQVVGSVVVNVIINGVIAYALFRQASSVPLWGQQGIAGDTIATAFFLPFFTTLIVTPLARKAVRAGQVEPLAWDRDVPAFLRWLPAGTFARSIVLGLLCMLIVAPPTVAILNGIGVTEQSFLGFVAFKALFAAALGAPLAPLIALLAIAPR